VELLISAGASLSVEDKEVIKTSVKLRLSNKILNPSKDTSSS
jgi:hypothetical protein